MLGLGAVITGITPKMAIRFFSFEAYKAALASPDGNVSFGATFLAGLGAGITEAVLVVTPMDVVRVSNNTAAMFYCFSSKFGYKHNVTHLLILWTFPSTVTLVTPRT